MATDEHDAHGDRVSSEHVVDAPSPSASSEAGSVPSGRHVRDDSERSLDLPVTPVADAEARTQESGNFDERRYSPDDTPLADPQILALIQASQHLHLPVQMPDAAAIKALRDADPETYQFWLTTVGRRVEHDMWVEKAPYELPYKLAARGQVAGIIGLVILSALTALAIVAGQPWVAGLFGVLDFVGVVSAFSRKDDDARHRELD